MTALVKNSQQRLQEVGEGGMKGNEGVRRREKVREWNRIAEEGRRNVMDEEERKAKERGRQGSSLI